MERIKCPNCGNEMNDYEVQSLWCSNCGKKYKTLSELDNTSIIINKNNELMKKAEGMIISTTPFLDGYRITRYINIVSEDVIFKASLSDKLSNSFDNMVDNFSFSEKELTGNSNILSKAKYYVIKKIRYKAAELGANAIVGVDIQSTTSSTSYAQVSINGTAVVIERVE